MPGMNMEHSFHHLVHTRTLEAQEACMFGSRRKRRDLCRLMQRSGGYKTCLGSENPAVNYWWAHDCETGILDHVDLKSICCIRDTYWGIQKLLDDALRLKR